MIRGRSIVVLGALAVFFGVGAVWLNHKDTQTTSHQSGHGALVLPDLAARINDVARIEIKHDDSTVTISSNGDRWVVEDRHAYPADTGPIRQLLLGLSSLSIIEEKTNNPALYAKLGLSDPAPGNAESVAVVLETNTGEKIAHIILGKQRPAKANPTNSEYYARLADNGASWLTEGNFQIQRQAPEWLAKTVLDIDETRIAEILINHADGETLHVRRDNKEVHDFSLVDASADKKIKSQFAINNIATALAKLSLQDVAKRDEVVGDKAFTLRAKTFDGLEIALDAVRNNDGKVFASLSATATPVDDSAQTADNTTPSSTPEDEAMSLNERWNDWLFELTPFQAENIAKKREDVVEPTASGTTP